MLATSFFLAFPCTLLAQNVVGIVQDGIVVFDDGQVWVAEGLTGALAVTPPFQGWTHAITLPGAVDEVSVIPDRPGVLVRQGNSVSWIRPEVTDAPLRWTGNIPSFGSPVVSFSGLETGNVDTSAFVLVAYEDGSFAVGNTRQSPENWIHFPGPFFTTKSQPGTWGGIKSRY